MKTGKTIAYRESNVKTPRFMQPPSDLAIALTRKASVLPECSRIHCIYMKEI